MLNKPIRNHANRPQKNRRQNRWPKALNHQTFDHGAGKPQHSGVDDEDKKTEGDYGDRQSKNQKDRPDKSVDQAKDKGRDQSRVERLNIKAGNDESGDEQGQGVYHPS